MTAERRLSPLSISMILHGLAVGVIVAFQWTRPTSARKIPVDVLVAPTVAPPQLNLQPSKPIEKPQAPPAPETKKVFGLSRKSILAESSDSSTAEVKSGNTVAKEMDDLKLSDDDADSLPIPADEYLVTSMPVLTSEVRVPYPREARDAGVEGAVILDLLIDEQGRVRQANLVRGPGYGLNEAALEAVRKFQFRPAKMEEKSVAVKIRYTYRFGLENR